MGPPTVRCSCLHLHWPSLSSYMPPAPLSFLGAFATIAADSFSSLPVDSVRSGDSPDLCLYREVPGRASAHGCEMACGAREERSLLRPPLASHSCHVFLCSCPRSHSTKGRIDLSQLSGLLEEQAKENLGMAMVFTLANAAKDWLRERLSYVATFERETDEARAKREEDEEDRRREELRRLGTPVTPETYARWFGTVQAEQALERAKLLAAGSGCALTFAESLAAAEPHAVVAAVRNTLCCALSSIPTGVSEHVRTRAAWHSRHRFPALRKPGPLRRRSGSPGGRISTSALRLRAASATMTGWRRLRRRRRIWTSIPKRRTSAHRLPLGSFLSFGAAAQLRQHRDAALVLPAACITRFMCERSAPAGNVPLLWSFLGARVECAGLHPPLVILITCLPCLPAPTVFHLPLACLPPLARTGTRRTKMSFWTSI